MSRVNLKKTACMNFSSLIQGGIDARQNLPHMTGPLALERDNCRQKSPEILPRQTHKALGTRLTKRMTVSSQFPFRFFSKESNFEINSSCLTIPGLDKNTVMPIENNTKHCFIVSYF